MNTNNCIHVKKKTKYYKLALNLLAKKLLHRLEISGELILYVKIINKKCMCARKRLVHDSRLAQDCVVNSVLFVKCGHIEDIALVFFYWSFTVQIKKIVLRAILSLVYIYVHTRIGR